MANADVFKSMGQKPGMSSEDIWGKVSTAPSQTVTGAVQPGAGGPGGSTTTTGAFQAAPTASAPSAAPAEVEALKGSGNYEYAAMSDGTIKITKSPRGGAGTIVPEDSPFYDLIMTDIAKFKAQGAKPAAKPAAPKAAAAPKGVGVADVGFAPSRETSRETPDEIADRLLSSMDGVERSEPAPKFGGMGEIRSSETGVPAMPKYEPPASMVGPSDRDKRKELGVYSSGIGGGLKLASLTDDARAGLIKVNMAPKSADATVRQLMTQMRDGDYNSLATLKAFAAM
jgi:hypothetical protein